ncbi:FAD-binding protein [Anaerotruncus sp. AF02-27]|uniref:NAD(P)/FAD-dependent oxidoreductase n=1 Tax=Anaerotruncus sp. AF02-27 TaxID=2292191 RepID=UPI000E4FE1D0|nr:FAD-dependent oxidoreductase [Anaerotruncus sp. AF02-27]RGX56815.1 FAD-binding protein [Anaerotruncus sp. AF02-27]
MYELIVVGGGPAGLAAAYAAWESGLQRILIVDRDQALGGILNQCIHSGFGLHRFGSELTGPEYAGRYIRMLQHTDVEVALETMVLEVTADRQVHMVSRKEGYRVLEAASVILAMGCRERTRGAIAIPGTRPAGVLTAGTAQRFVNLDGYLPGRRVVILGSGDIGLIMARRMTLEGAKVLCCVEIMPYSSGLNRNIVQCLRDYDIPLYLSHTITEIRGRNRVEQVVLAKVDERRMPIPGTERVLDCDTLLLSVGLIPENELTRKAGIKMDRRTGGAIVYENMETSLPGIFACGNVVHVHDLVDFVSAESERAGKAAASYVLHKEEPQSQVLELIAGEGIFYTVPQKIHLDKVGQTIEIFFRVTRPCNSSRIRVTSNGTLLSVFKREHLAPGEMEHIRLPRELFEKATGSLELSIEEVIG